jgi:hypothetical protein
MERFGTQVRARPEREYRMTWLWWAPLAAAALHVTEEFFYPGGFADWDRKYRPSIQGSITTRFHIVVNAALLLLCLQVGLFAGAHDVGTRHVGVALWLTVAALLFSNALYHLLGTLRTGTRSPGVVTGVGLYVPMAAIGFWYFLRTGEASVPTAIAAALLGGSYQLWAGLLHRIRARQT